MAPFTHNIFLHLCLIAQNTKNNDFKDISIKGQTQTSAETKAHSSAPGRTSSTPSGGKTHQAFLPFLSLMVEYFYYCAFYTTRSSLNNALVACQEVCHHEMRILS